MIQTYRGISKECVTKKKSPFFDLLSAFKGKGDLPSWLKLFQLCPWMIQYIVYKSTSRDPFWALGKREEHFSKDGKIVMVITFK